MPHELRIAELLCTRLCHDLTGPIGAVNNGAEFLSEEGFDMQNQAVDLIVSSAAEAVSRLQFYRLAYGKVNDNGEANLDDKKQRIEEFFQGSKLKLDWPDSNTDAAGISISNKMARILLNMIVIASGTLLKGGTIIVRLSDDGSNKSVSVKGVGDAVKVDPAIPAVLTGKVGEEEVTPKTVQLYLCRRLADELGAGFELAKTDAGFEITLKQPH